MTHSQADGGHGAGPPGQRRTHCDLGAPGTRPMEAEHDDLQAMAAVSAFEEAGPDEVVRAAGREVDAAVGQAVAVGGGCMRAAQGRGKHRAHLPACRVREGRKGREASTARLRFLRGQGGPPKTHTGHVFAQPAPQGNWGGERSLKRGGVLLQHRGTGTPETAKGMFSCHGDGMQGGGRGRESS